MGSFVLLPSATGSQRGTWSVTGAATAHQAVADSSDLSYINLAAPVTNYGHLAGSTFFYIQPQSLPFKARVKYMMAYARAAATTTDYRLFFTRIHDGRYPSLPWTTSIPYSLSTTISDYTGYGETFAPSSPAHLDEYATRPLPGATGDPITQSVLDTLQIEVFGFTWEDIRFYKLGIHVEYDEQPVVNLVSPSGATDSGSPVVSWEFFDDTETQSGYQVEIYSGSTLIYESGVRPVGTPFHQYEGTPLANGTYTVRVRASQFWTGSGDTFWSEWDSSTFTVTESRLATPELKTTIADGYIDVDVAPYLNLLSFNAVGSESNATGGHPDWYTLSNATVASSATSLSRSGSVAHAMTLTGTTGEIISERFPVNASQLYEATIYQKLITGSTANGNISIRWYDSSGAVVSTNAGTPASVNSSGYTLHTITATAPLLARSAAIIATFSGSSGNVTLIDDASMVLSPSGFSGPDLSESIRGGMFEHAAGNLLTIVNAAMDNAHSWQASTNTTLTSELTPNRHGTAGSIKAKNTSGSTNDIEARIGSGAALTESTNHFEVTAGSTYRLHASIYSPVSSRTAAVGVMWYGTDLALISTTNVTGASSVGSWTDLAGTLVAPAGAAYGRMRLGVASTANNEEHYFDRVSVQLYDAEKADQWREGIRTVTGPYLVIEFSENYPDEWRHLITFPTDSAISPDDPGYFTYRDYEVAHGVERYYRAYVWGTVNDKRRQSAYSNVNPPESIDLEQVWLHVKGDEEDTAYNFLYATPGRSETISNDSHMSYFEGRDFPLTEFGEYKDRSFQVQLQLIDTESLDAFRTIAERKALVVYRDQRGRRGIVRLDGAQIVDEQWGNSVSFTVNLSGDQPW